MTMKTILKKPIIATIAATILLGTILVISNTLTNDVVAQGPCPAGGEAEQRGNNPKCSRVITYSGAETNPGGTDLVLGTVNKGAETFIGCSSGQCVSFTSMHTIPDGATLTKLECFFKDPDAGSNIFCRLQRGQTTGTGFDISTLLGTSVSSPNVQSLSDTFNHVVDRSANNYHIVWQADPSCTTCRIIAVQVTYTEK